MRLYLNYLLLFSFCHTIFALSINREHTQKPMSHISKPISSRPTSVILAITVTDNDIERYIEIPLGQRTLPDAGLPRHLKSAKIVALVNADRQAAPLEKLDRTICRVVPVPSMEEKSGLLRELEKDWLWFMLADEEVHFEQSSSRWFLAGREIGNYECR
ncbi:hypothetical protein K505DRAFT_254804 [Melanomma pulvis-pyrius CBS 109.77]|uniref:Uncharacterized protein n=1 Tax=Melanomma pulvis-pyrius CBS 109.77 TaxID=1314802 RepID=A0A6A6WXU0_9PLEO|nr:hypothetical protein K505DRAFT_254804 [Melanomma pulvis-pyrius CBS 109.77]